VDLAGQFLEGVRLLQAVRDRVLDL